MFIHSCAPLPAPRSTAGISNTLPPRREKRYPRLRVENISNKSLVPQSEGRSSRCAVKKRARIPRSIRCDSQHFQRQPIVEHSRHRTPNDCDPDHRISKTARERKLVTDYLAMVAMMPQDEDVGLIEIAREQL